MTPEEIAAFVAKQRAQLGCDPADCPNGECDYHTLCTKGIATSHAGNVVSLPALADANAADLEVTAGAESWGGY